MIEIIMSILIISKVILDQIIILKVLHYRDRIDSNRIMGILINISIRITSMG